MRALKAALRTVARLLLGVKTSGDDASFTNPRTLIVANHESFLDGLLLALFLPVELICKLVESGKPVIIFPAGRLTVTGSLMKVYDGAAFIADRVRGVSRCEGDLWVALQARAGHPP